LFVGGLLLYVLSFGPIVWIFSRTHWTPPQWFENAMEGFYAPLEWAARQLPWLGTFLDWYTELL
jgi:hypothetical protein